MQVIESIVQHFAEGITFIASLFLQCEYWFVLNIDNEDWIWVLLADLLDIILFTAFIFFIRSARGF